MAGLVSINGSIELPEEAKISALDRGFLFGDNIFEVFVAVCGRIFHLQDHLERLEASARLCHMSIPWKREQLAFEMQNLVDQVNDDKVYVRLVVTRVVAFAFYPENLSIIA